MSDVIEPAPSGRAKCRGCGEKIERAVLRFGEGVENPYGEGESRQWFHLACAAERRSEKLNGALAEYSGDVPDREALLKAAADGAENPKLCSVLGAERAASGRASCQHCREKIAKDALRIVMEREGETMARPMKSYVHLSCGVAEFGAHGLADKLVRMSPALAEAEQAEIRELCRD